MKFNKKICLIIILSIVGFIGFLCLLIFVSKIENSSNGLFCGNIVEAKKNKDNFIIIIVNNVENTNIEAKDAILEIKNKYSDDIKFYEFDYSILTNKCFEEFFEDAGIYKSLLENSGSPVISYVEGKFSGISQNVSNFISLEEILVEQKVITKKDGKESITYRDYVNNIKNEYLLLIVTDESVKKIVSNNMNKVFGDMEQDTIYAYGSLGEKIINDLKKSTKVYDVYPQLFYFKDGRVVYNDYLYSVDEFKDFKKQIYKK